MKSTSARNKAATSTIPARTTVGRPNWAGILRFGLLTAVLGGSVLAQTWIQLQPTGQAPVPNAGHNNPTAPYDVANNRLIIFGGGFAPRSNDTWVLTNANGAGGTPTWTKLAPTSPLISARSDCSIVYDPGTNRLIVFGGLGGSGDNYSSLNDTWVLTNANGLGGAPHWIQLNPTGGPPLPRSTGSAAYDPSSNRLILFGGFTTTGFGGDTWVLTNANGLGGTPQWTQLQPTGTIQPRGSHSVVYDGTSNRLIVFGGDEPTCNVAGDVMILTNANGLGGTPQWTPLSPIPGSFGRYNMGAAYDSVDNRYIVFGGASSGTPCGAGLGDTNEVDVLTGANGQGSTPAWTKIAPSGTPPVPRESSTVAYDPATNRLIVFGGGIFTDVWILTNANGIVESQLGISQVFPGHGGNAGNVTTQIVGSGFQTGATVRLTGVGPDVVGENVFVLGASVMTTTFDLEAVAPGVRSVIVTNPDGTSGSLPDGFTVVQGGSPNLAISIIGLERIRFGTPQQYYVLLQNNGSVDATNVTGFVTQSGSTQSAPNPSNAYLLSSPTPITSFFGTVPPLSSRTIPYTATGPATSICQFIDAGAHLVVPDDPCSVFEAAKASGEMLINSTYAARLTNLLALLSAIGNGLCFSPANPASVANCDAYENIDSYFESALEGAEGAEAALCGFAAAAGCPLNCQDPEDINYLQAITDGAKNTVDKLKAAFQSGATTDTLRSELAAYQRQALALPASLAFPTQPSPQPANNIPLDSSSSLQVCGVGSLDPNDKSGSKGIGASQFVEGGGSMPYFISFENASTANAPARAITITDSLDAGLDLASIALGPINFPDHVVNPSFVPLVVVPFTTLVDLRPLTNLLVKINASLDMTNAVLTWTFQSLDPATNLPPTDPLAGFLPPGGEGGVFFTVRPKASVSTGAVIRNSASVVFDANPPIDTATWFNTIDNTKPTSYVTPLATSQAHPSFTVQWSGIDVGSGVQDYSVYASDNGSAFSPWQTQTTATQATYPGVVGHTYSFYSIARDLVGNVEGAKSAAEATTTAVTAPTCAADVSTQVNVVRGGFRLNNTTQRFVQSITLTNKGSGTIQGPVFLVLDALSANATLFNKTGTTACAAPLGSPYVNLGIANLGAGQSATVSLEFTNPTKAGITDTTRVLAGTANK